MRLEWFNSFLEVILRGSFFLDWAHIFWDCLPKRQFSTNHQWNRYIETGTITLDLIVQANKRRCTVADQSGGLTFGTPELVLVRVDDWLPVFSSESLGVSYLCMHPCILQGGGKLMCILQFITGIDDSGGFSLFLFGLFLCMLKLSVTEICSKLPIGLMCLSGWLVGMSACHSQRNHS